VECPPGSWCSGSMKTTCPTGTSSKSMSKNNTDCYCLAAYTGDIDCDARSMASHLPCDVGYARSASFATLKKWGCEICQAGSWCDGAVAQTCPKGTTTAPGNSDPEKCSCYTGYTRAQCHSVLTFTVSLETTVQLFDDTKQGIYKDTLALFLKVPATSIVVEVKTTGAQRRLLATTIEVANHITVPDTMKDSIKDTYDKAALKRSLTSNGFTVASISDADVSSTDPNKTDDLSVGAIIGITAGVLVFTGGAIILYMRSHTAQEYTPLEKGAAPMGPQDPKPPQPQPPQQLVQEGATAITVVSLKTAGFMDRLGAMV